MHVGCIEHFKHNWLALVLNIVAGVGIAVHGVVYGAILPSNVVYHYDAYGNPDRSANTRDFIALYWLVSLVSTVLMVFLSFLFSSNCCAVGCSSPEEASYTASGRRYLRLTVASWSLWLNLAVLALIFTVFAVLLQNSMHPDTAESFTTFGVYLPFFIFAAGLVVLIFFMFSHIQSAKALMYAGYFKDEGGADPSMNLSSDDGNTSTDSHELEDLKKADVVKVQLVEDDHYEQSLDL